MSFRATIGRRKGQFMKEKVHKRLEAVVKSIKERKSKVSTNVNIIPNTMLFSIISIYGY